MKKALLISFALILLGCCSADAYDLVVTVLSGNISRQKQIDLTLNACYPDTYATITKGQLNTADSTYLFKDLPNERLFIIFMKDGGFYGEEVNEPTDSIVTYINENEGAEATNLNEVVVEGENSYLTDEKEIYLPTSRDKKISKDGASLLQNMAISSLYVSPIDKTITTASGDAVSTFIDYLPASKTDLENIKASNVQKVEVLDYPKDPRFNGAQHVVNYVMVKYDYGGYTRLRGSQGLIYDLGNYGGYSLLTTRRMTYDVGLNYTYTNTKQLYTTDKTEYKFQDRTVLSENIATNATTRNRNLGAFFRALYRTDKTVISNIIGVSTSKKPKNHSAYSETFNVDDYESSISESFNDSKNKSISWNGNYQFYLPNDFTWLIYSNASYGSFDSDYKYTVGSSNVTNYTDEKVWSASVNTSLSKNIKGHTFSLELFGGVKNDDIDYSGTTPASVIDKNYFGGFGLYAAFKINKVTLEPNVGMTLDRNVFNEIAYNRYEPSYRLSAVYFLNRKNKFTFASEIKYKAPTISQMGSNIQIQNQIEAITGNPDLKTEIANSFRLNYQYFATRNLSFTAYARYSRNSRLITSNYEPTTLYGQDYMLRYLTNSGFRNLYRYGLSASARLLNRALSLRVSAEGNNVIQHGETYYNLSQFVGTAQAIYSFSNMYVSAMYQTKLKQLNNWGTLEQPQYYTFEVGYTYKNFNFSATASNLFNSAYKGHNRYEISGNRLMTQQEHTPEFHRIIQIGVVYTFSYGKKLGNVNEASAPSGVQSGSLK